MKNIFLLLALFTIPLFAAPVGLSFPFASGCINAANTPILPSYSPSSPGSLLLTLSNNPNDGVESNASASHLAVTYNSLGTAIQLSVNSNNMLTTPTPVYALASNPNQLEIGSNLTLVFDNVRVGSLILVASNSGTISTGILCVAVW